MHQDLALSIAVIIGAGVCTQWLAGRLRVPSVLLLLPAGILAGPVTGLVDPDELFGDALFPLIAIAVGLILFEGGLGLDLAKVRQVGRPVAGLVSVGLAVTWAVGAGAATLLFGFPPSMGVLMGAILVVSGPTVVLPLLASVRLREPVAPVLQWECIVIDPIGAVLAVAVFQAIIDAETGFNPLSVLASSAAVGVAVGVVAGFGLAVLLRRHAVPDRLQSPLTLATVVVCFVAADALSVEAGLFATTVMGVVMANQRLAPVAHIAAFGEDVGLLLLGALFIVLGATIELGAVRAVLLPGLVLLVVLLAVRPVAVWLATLGSSLTRRDRAYLSLIAPRGVVAAAVAALFSVSLREEGVEGAAELAPAVFCVIIGSVAIASLVASPAARWLRVASAERTGVALVGDEPWLLDLASDLGGNDVPVLLVQLDSDQDDAADRGLLSYRGALDDPALDEAMAAVGVGAAVMAVESDAAGSYLVEHLSEALGRGNVYVVRVGDGEHRNFRSRAWGRRAFGGAMDRSRDEDRRWSIATLDVGDLPGDGAATVPLVYVRDDGTPAVAGPRGRGRGARRVIVARRSSGLPGPARRPGRE